MDSWPSFTTVFPSWQLMGGHGGLMPDVWQALLKVETETFSTETPGCFQVVLLLALLLQMGVFTLPTQVWQRWLWFPLPTALSCTLDGRPPDGGQTARSASEPTGGHALLSPYLWSMQETRETDIVKSLKIVSLLRRHQLQTQPVLRNAESGQAGSWWRPFLVSLHLLDCFLAASVS